MIVAVKLSEILDDDDLLGAPAPGTLATGKSIVVFNLKITPKTSALEAGIEFEYAGETYVAMNAFRVQAATDYLKLNAFKKSSRAEPI